ncbi:protein CCA1-like [Musa acuminata AAA Group]|uniref:protein CCA1-like n=1 Tax=Musa acuminata AAA Group TaxID=214697 RepID=UPI0031D09FDE
MDFHESLVQEALAPHETTSGKPLKSISPSTNKVMDIKVSCFDQKFMMAQKLQNEEISEDRSHSEVVNIFQDTVPASISSVNKGSSNYRKYTKFLSTEEMEDKIAINKSLNKEPSEKGKSLSGKETGVQGDCIYPHINLVLGNGASTSVFQGLTSKNTVKGDQTHPKKPATHIIGRNGKSMDTEDSDDRNPTAVTGQVGDHANANPSMNPIAFAIPVQNVSIIRSVHHPFPAFTHLTHFQSSQDAYRSFLNISSTFSSLIVSTLLQNPAVHAAASMAASLWPSAEAETSLRSTAEFLAGEIPGRHMNPTPSLEAIAAVTVAVAAAWWAAQGLLPYSYDSGRGENSSELKGTRSDKFTPSVFIGFHSSDKARNKKKQDCSSCGSNTPSSSEVEMNTIEKHEKVDGEAKEAYSSDSAACKINNRRFIIGGNMNESWKEVSEEVAMKNFHRYV